LQYSDTLLDRARIAPQRLLHGDLSGASDALLNPSALSPEQAKEWAPKDNHPISVAMRTISNPLVLLGAALSFAYPVASASNLFKMTKYLKGLGEVSINPYSRPLNPILHKLQGISIFMGTKLGQVMHNLVDAAHDFKIKSFLPFEQEVLAYESRMGKAASLETQLATSGLLDNLHDPKNSTWKYVRARAVDLFKKQHPEWGEQELAKAVAPLGPAGGYSNWAQHADMGLHSAARASTEEMWKEMFSRPEYVEKLLKSPAMRSRVMEHLEEMGVEVGTDPAMIIKALQEKNFQKIHDYWPHVRSRSGPEQEEIFRAKLLEGVGKTMDEFGYEITSESAVNPVTKRLEKRRHRMIPDPRDLELMPHLLTPGTLDVLKKLAAPASEGGLGLSTYSLRLTGGMSHLAHTMSKTFAWTAKGHGDEWLAEYGVLAKEDQQGIKKHLARNVYLPLLLGRIDPAETVQALAWSDTKYRAYKFFEKPEVREAFGEKFSAFAQKTLKTPAIQNLTFKNAGAKLAGWFYGSTLIANPASAGLNALQTLHSVGAVTGGKYLLSGYKEAIKDVAKFAEVYAEGGLTMADAFEKAIPHYSKFLGGVSEIEASAALRRAMKGGGTWASRYEQAKAVGMSLFTGTERFNKLVAFHSGRIKALAEGLGGEAAEQLGQKVMEVTQFPGGILGTPIILQNLWGPLKQFAQFPLRTLEMAFHTGPLLGAAEKSAPDWIPMLGGRNYGTLGRMLLGAGMAQGAGELAGLDLSKGLLFGAAPTPDDPDQPFYPMPFVPPLVGLVGGVASDIFSGDNDWKQSRRNLPLLVPGGVSLARVTSYVSPELARFLGRGYADFQNRGPHGEVPVYSADGSLKGYETPLQMFGRAVGWNSLTGDPEAELSQYLVKQRDKIRNYRREYIEAIANNDGAKQQSVEAAWKKEYPQLGEIIVKASDIQAVHMRHEVSRVERILQTMPEEARQLYGPMVGAVLGEASEQFLGVDPALLVGGTTKQRDPQRVSQGSTFSQNIQAWGEQQSQPAQIRETASLGLRNDHVGRQPNQAFTAFEGFNRFGE